MARTARCLVGLLALVAVSVLPGCPMGPVLVVSPQSLHFGSDSALETFRIANEGIGAMSYTVSEDVPWLDVTLSAPQVGGGKAIIEGSTTTDPVFFDVKIDRSQLAIGESHASIFVTSSGGNATVNVSVSTTGPATLNLSGTALDLGYELDSGSVTVGNVGTSTLIWTATVAQDAPWLTVNGAGTVTGDVPRGSSPDTLVLAVNRAGLPAGEYTGTVTLATNDVNRQITVVMRVASFVVAPLIIDLGQLNAPLATAVEVSNRGTETINLEFVPSTADGGEWLVVQPDTLALTVGPPQGVQLTVDPTGLPTGNYQGTVTVTDVDTSFTQTISVTMEKVGFVASPLEIDFGSLTDAATRTLTLTNLSQSSTGWNLAIPPAARWLSADAGGGTLGGGQSLDVALIADPSAVEPDQYETTLTLTHDNGTIQVLVRMSEPRPPALEVSSRNIDFGGTSTSQFLGVIHAGDYGTIDWSISTTGLPAWLTITTSDSRVNVGGTSVSGTLTATANNRSHGLTLRVRRDLAPEGEVNFSHTLNVVGTGDVDTTIPVQISMTVPPLPEIVIDADQVDEFGVDFVNIPTNEDDGGFLIINEGDSQLEWSIDLADQPDWITSVSPNRGVLDPGRSTLVTVLIDREGQSFGSLTHVLNVASNDPVRAVVPVRVETQVPKVILIGTRGTLAFGSDATTLTLEVANVGDPDTILDFRIVPSKEWVSVFPDTGQSRGTADPIKDWRAVSVAIDRTQLTDSAASATLTVFAVETVGGTEVPRADVTPVEVPLSAEAASLNIEVSIPRVRIPSLVRYDMLMRNIRFQTIDFTKQTEFENLRQQFRISENETGLELTETGQFVKDGDKLRTNLLILLDYSNSMVEAARVVEDPAISGAADPLQAMYESCLIPMIQELPDRFRIAIGVFNERRVVEPSCPVSFETVRIVKEDPLAPNFVSDDATLIGRIQSINVTDHGASEIYPAVIDGVAALLSEDERLISFDETDIRALMCITDGRGTTSSTGDAPPVNLILTEVLDALADNRVRFYPLGWGIDVLANPLVQMAQISGGHFYSTRTVRSGAADAFGRVTRLPIASELRGWCAADTLAIDAQILQTGFATWDADANGQMTYVEALAGVASLAERDFARIDLDGNGYLVNNEILEAIDVLTLCDQSIPRDLQSYVTLGYVTLNEEPSATVEVKLSFDDENDNNSICLPQDQGNISSGFTHGQMPFDFIAGDVRLGQISVRSDGLQPDNSATLRISADYVPRNVSQIRLRITPIGAPTPSVTLVPATGGGIVGNWNLLASGTVYEISSPDGAPLPYGAYGDLLQVRFENVNTEFAVGLAVETPVWSSGNNDSKYFTITDRFEVRTTPTFAQAFPHPEIRTDPATVVDECPVTVDLGQDNDTAVFEVHNVGGNHQPTGVWLRFLVSLGPDSDFLLLPQNLLDEFPEHVFNSTTPYEVTVGLDRTIDPGSYIGSLLFQYDFGSVHVGFEEPRPIYVTYQVRAPQLVVSTNNLDFGTTTTDLPLVVSNGGQSTLDWSINTALLPQWLAVGESSGSLMYDSTPNDGTPNTDTQTFQVRVFRTGLTPGNYTADILVQTDDGQQQTLTVTMTVP